MHTGLDEFAEHIASVLLCTQPEANTPCQQCRGCQLFQAGSHPDFLNVRGENGTIKVAQARQISEFSHLSAHQGHRRVVLVYASEQMNANTQNALLKILEEPPAEMYLFLLCHRPGLLLSTVVSRLTRLDLGTPDPEIARGWLQEQGLDSELLNLVPVLQVQQVQDEGASGVHADLELFLQNGRALVDLVERYPTDLLISAALVFMRDNFTRAVQAKRGVDWVQRMQELHQIGEQVRTNNLNPQVQLQPLLYELNGLVRSL